MSLFMVLGSGTTGTKKMGTWERSRSWCSDNPWIRRCEHPTAPELHFASQLFENRSNPLFVQKSTYLHEISGILFLTEVIFSFLKNNYSILRRHQMTRFLSHDFLQKLEISVDTQDLDTKVFV